MTLARPRIICAARKATSPQPIKSTLINLDERAPTAKGGASAIFEYDV
jgi:hypothetical protein